MPIVPNQELLNHAHKNHYCVPGFDVYNLESLQAVIKAAERTRSPVLVQTSFMNFDFYEMRSLCTMLRSISSRTTVPISIHLDHGARAMPLSIIPAVLEEGFCSIMADGSSMPLDENILFVKKVQQIAAPFKAAVEGELGEVSRDPSMTREQIIALMTDPYEAEFFVKATGVDFLAVSVGSITSCFDTSKIELDFDRLGKISEKTRVPLVFHGGTGIPAEAMKTAISMGISKCNIAHGLRKIFCDESRKAFPQEIGYVDPRPVMKTIIDKIVDYAEAKFELFGCVGRADSFFKDTRR